MFHADFIKGAIGTFVLLLAITWANTALAQQADADEPDEPGVVVVLEPRIEQELDLSSKIEDATGREVKGQEWFLEQVQARGFKPKQILTRPDDLKWVVGGANIDLIVYMPREDEKLLLKLVGDDGREITSRILVESVDEELSDENIQMIVNMAKEQLGAAEPEVAVATLDEPVEDELTTPTEEKIEPSASLKKRMSAGESDTPVNAKWLHFYVGATLTERSYVLTDRTLRSASLRTPLYPGYRAGVVAYPFWTEKRPARAAGFLVEFGHAFDSLTLVQESGRTDVAVTQLEIEAAFLYRFQGFDEFAYGDEPAIALRAGAHWASYDADNELNTPLSTSHLAVDLGVRVEQALWTEWVGLEWDLLVHPYVGDLTDRASGDQQWGLGFSTDASLNLKLFAGAHLRLGWGARVTRTWFEGIAANNFEDLDSIVFEHSPTAAVNYWW